MRDHDRYNRAVEFRRSGMTYKEVGKRLCVSTHRAREMCISHERFIKKIESADNPVIAELYNIGADFRAECFLNKFY